MQDTRLAEAFDVSTLEDEVSALVDRGGPQAFAPPGIRRPLLTNSNSTKSRREDDSQVDANTGAENASETHDSFNHPRHYTVHPSGVECIVITEWMNFCLGNAIKYIWRASEKGATIEDLKKARWYLDREIARLEKLAQ